MDYDALLKKGYEQLPESLQHKERFEVPKAKGHLEGSKTIISNFPAIVDTLRREESHVLKFLLKSLATVGKIEYDRLILGSKINSVLFNQKIEDYVNLYVMCRECNRPDTKIVKENNIQYLVCQACGAKTVVK